MQTIWYCATCRVAVRVPEDTTTGFRCPRCLTRIDLDGRAPARRSPEPKEDVEVLVDVRIEDAPVRPAPEATLRLRPRPRPVPPVPARVEEEEIEEVEAVVESPEPEVKATPPLRREYDEYDNRPMRRPRRKRKKRSPAPVWVWLIVGGVGLLAVSLVVGVAIAFAPAPLVRKPHLSLEKMDKIKAGMSQSDVERILGGPGTVLSREEIGFGPDAGKEMKSVRWEDPGRGHLQMAFIDDKATMGFGND